jgi:hypothetical protein
MLGGSMVSVRIDGVTEYHRHLVDILSTCKTRTVAGHGTNQIAAQSGVQKCRTADAKLHLPRACTTHVHMIERHSRCTD